MIKHPDCGRACEWRSAREGECSRSHRCRTVYGEGYQQQLIEPCQNSHAKEEAASAGFVVSSAVSTSRSSTHPNASRTEKSQHSMSDAKAAKNRTYR